MRHLPSPGEDVARCYTDPARALHPGPTPVERLPSHPPEFTPSPFPIRSSSRRLLWLQALLLPATVVTLTLAGLWWEDPPDTAGGSTWRFGLPYAGWVMAILGSHEMGHYLACRFHRVSATLPFFIPGIPPIGSFGAVIRIRARIPDRRALFDIAAAGPIAGFAVALPVLLTGLLVAEPFDPGELEGAGGFGLPLVVWFLGDLLPEGPIRTNQLIGAGWVGMLVTSLNLFPVGQLDGGHIAYALSRRLHRLLARLSLVVMFSLILFQALVLRQVPAYVLWFGILLWMRDRHPRLLDERNVGITPGRKLIALVLLAILLLSFIPVPFIL